MSPFLWGHDGVFDDGGGDVMLLMDRDALLVTLAHDDVTHGL
jgi:hypothetical protein